MASQEKRAGEAIGSTVGFPLVDLTRFDDEQKVLIDKLLRARHLDSALKELNKIAELLDEERRSGVPKVTNFLSKVERQLQLSKAVDASTNLAWNLAHLRPPIESMPVITNIICQDKDLLLKWARFQDEGIKLVTIRVLGEIVDVIDDPQLMNALFEAMSCGGEAQKTAWRKLARSPFLPEYLVRESEGSSCVCSGCFHRFEKHSYSPEMNTTYWACRFCHGVIHVKSVDRIVIVLDCAYSDVSFFGDNVMAVNWIDHKSLFDFDEVWVGDMDNFAIEQFVVQVRNDLDIQRRNGYRSMPVFVTPDHRLSQAKYNLLRDTFGKVEIKDFRSE